MVKVRKRGETVRQFILVNIEKNPKNIVQIASEKFGISRQAINKHIKVLVNQNAIQMHGTTRSRFYTLSTDDDYGFTKIIVPVDLIRYGDELLVSRSQAKRLLARIEKFKTVILDFEGVRSIGQAFADEIFKVFTLRNKDITVLHINANKDVEQMIMHAILNK